MIARQTLLTRVTSLLSQAGWNQRPSHNAGLMTKSYNSALGIQTAYTYLGWLFEGTSSGYLQAEYQCGGRNILATINARVSAQMTEEELSGVVDRFVVAVDAAVAMSHLAYRMIS